MDKLEKFKEHISEVPITNTNYIIFVCGGRDYDDYETVKYVLNTIVLKRGLPPTVVVHGDATGADLLGKLWAIEFGFKHDPYPAEWNKYGKAAGPIRNNIMANILLKSSQNNFDIEAICFPGGRGTKNMKQQLKDVRLDYVEVDDDF